jgi:adenine-specific DNA-methyltransferase
VSDRLVPRSSTVYTPSDLAAAMVRVAQRSQADLWLDPCVGDGAFVVEMAGAGIQRDRIRALDIVPRPSVCDRLARTMRGVDFIEWAGRNSNSVDRVVMNPPYVAINRLGGAPRRNALAVSFASGRKLTLGTNYWCAFLIKAVTCLRSGGTLIAVLPAAWDFARYAARVRDEVAQSFEHLTVIRCSSPLFPTVKDGAVVLVGKNRGAAPARHERIEVANLAETIATLEALGAGGRPKGATTIRSLPKRETHRVRLDSFLEIGIGAVTGDAHYFLLSESERKELNLPLSAVRPVLSRCKQLVSAVIDGRQWRQLRDGGERIWLFRPGKAARKQAAVKTYLWHGARGECNMSAFKIASRPEWHQTRLPRRVDGFLSGMSKRLPFLVLQAMPGLTATNTLYVVRFRHAASASERAGLGVTLLTSEVRRELRRHARNYADGLLKFEPRELGNIQVPVVSRHAGAISVFKQATALLLEGRETESEALANEWAAVASGASSSARALHGARQSNASRRSA